MTYKTYICCYQSVYEIAIRKALIH